MAKAWHDAAKSNSSGKDGNWFFQLRINAGDRRSLTLSKADYPSLGKAQEKANDILREARGLGVVVKIDRKQPLGQYGLEVIANRTVGGKVGGDPISASTKANYTVLWNAYVVPAIGGLRLDKITQPVIESALNTIRKDHDLTRNSLAAVATVLRVVIGVGAKAGVWSMEMWHRVDWPTFDKPKAKRGIRVALTEAEISHALARLETPFDRLRFYFGAVLNMRSGEILAVRWTDLMPTAVPGYCAQVQVRRTLSNGGPGVGTVVAERTKSEAGMRDGLVPDYMAADLEVWRNTQVATRQRLGLPIENGDWYILSNKRGERGGRNNLLDWWNTLKADGVVPADFTPHNMRHTFGSHAAAANNGVSPALAKIMGHSNMQVTAESYAQAIGKDEIAVSDAFHARMRVLVAPPILPPAK